ncbi:uncharacterized protein DSM5745_07976 [Aspergillus mulundensis]|uniref:Uncharacterized protein n=1 Tax=Aspergillus mulundensis TaxID=1810919 RepID=A0A3D8R8X2_9EURO|nr:hypothetical protein DSM5745_07976 [Aspergillus mulundensis]RDW70465.1 hypothetical protein DSM5745_07976 [Aspergillus mulundensis]
MFWGDDALGRALGQASCMLKAKLCIALLISTYDEAIFLKQEKARPVCSVCWAQRDLLARGFSSSSYYLHDMVV